MAGQSKLSAGMARNAKVLGGVIFVAVVGLGVAIYAMKNRTVERAKVDLPQNLNVGGGKSTAETPHYAQVVQTANQDGYASAAAAGSSFIPVFSDRAAVTKPIEQDLSAREAATPGGGIMNGTGGSSQAQQLPPLPPPSKGVETEVASLEANWQNQNSTQEVLGLQAQEAREAAESSAQEPGSHKQANSAAAANASSASAASTHSGPASIATSTRIPAHAITAYDSDAPADSPYEVVLDTGPYTGAVLSGKGQLTNDSVTASFTKMTFNGKTVAIDAVALNEETLAVSLPADIDHRYISRILVPAAVGAIGAAGQVYQTAGSTVTQSPLGGTQTVANPNPGLEQVVGGAVNGGTQATTQIIQKTAAAIPPVHGTTSNNITMLVEFRQDVYLQ